MWYIVNKLDGTEYPISEDGLIIGRENCAILTPAADSRASRQHAIVRICGDHVEVEDMGSSNGTYIDEQRIYSPTVINNGQNLRCGQTIFQLIGKQVSPRSMPTIIASDNATMASAEPYLNVPFSPQNTAPPPVVPYANQSQPSPQAYHEQPPYNQPASQYQYQQSPTPPLNPGSNNALAIIGIIIGVVLLIIGIFGWQHYQPQMNTINSMFGQVVIGIGGDSASREVAQIKMIYMGSIVLACVGGIIVLASAIRLAMSHK